MRLTKNKGFNKDNNKHQFFNLSLLKWKKTMNRPKDQNDIILIKKLLKIEIYIYNNLFYKLK